MAVIDWGAVEAWVVGLPMWLLFLLIFLSSFMEGVPILGIPFPGNLVVSAVAIQAGLAHHNPLPLIVFHALGGVAADAVFYALGRRYGIAFLTRATSRMPPWMSWLKYDDSREGQLRALLDSHGFKTILLARVSPGVRNMFAWAAGAVRARPLRVLAGAVTGGFLIASFFVASGYLVGLGYQEAGAILGKTLTYAVAGIIVALLLGYLLTRRLRLFAPHTLVLTFGALASIPAFVAVLAGHLNHGRVRTWDEAHPGGLAFLQGMDVPTWITGPEPWLTAILVVFALLCLRSRWREALATAAATGLLIGGIVFMHAEFPRPAPDGHTIFPLQAGFVDMTAALVVLATAFVAAHFLPAPSTFNRKLVLGTMWGLGLALAVLPLASGRVYLGDTLAGVALGAATACLALLADILARNLVHPPEGDHPGARLVRSVRARGERVLDGFARVAVRPVVAWSLVGFGVAARLYAPWQWALGPDATRYAAMGHAFTRTGTFWLEWGDVYTPGAAGASHHYPPLYPMILAGFYKVLGFSEDTTRLASIALSLAAMLVVYVCTRDLYGKASARIVTTVAAVSPVLIQTTSKGYAENLVLLLFVGSMWGILKSLEKPWYIVAGGACAALAYLTKSSMGYFFIVAGLGGLAWRLYWKGWRVLTQKPYLVAIVLFGSAVVAWGYRNWSLFGDWQTSPHLSGAYALAFDEPGAWLHLMPWSLAVMFGLGYLLFMAVLPWLPQLAAIPRLKNEHDSGLWLSIGLPVVLTVLIDAALWNYERQFFLHNVRYVSFASVPLAWLLLRHAPSTRRTWAAVAASFAVLIVMSLYYAAIPNVPPQAEASDVIGHVLGDGQRLAFVDTNDVYRAYFDATHNGTRTVDIGVYYGAGAQNVTEDWVYAQGLQPDLPASYARFRDVGHLSIWHRDSVAA